MLQNQREAADNANPPENSEPSKAPVQKQESIKPNVTDKGAPVVRPEVPGSEPPAKPEKAEPSKAPIQGQEPIKPNPEESGSKPSAKNETDPAELKFLDNAISPLLIASAALLALVSLRNGDIATRSRNNVDELLYKATKEKLGKNLGKRRANLRYQLNKFYGRYILTSFCFASLALALAFVAAAGFFAKQENKHTVAIVLIGIGGAFFVVGLLLIIIELGMGYLTLKKNNISADE
jgi:hypothetical protein